MIGVWIVAIEDWVRHDGHPSMVEILDRALAAMAASITDSPRSLPLP